MIKTKEDTKKGTGKVNLFIDECRIVTGGLDKTIKLLTFNPVGESVDDPKEFKMTLQCQGMKVDGVIRDKERKRLQELIDKAEK